MWEVRVINIYSVHDSDYVERLNKESIDGWEPFASEYYGDGWHRVVLKRKITEYNM